MDAGAKPSWGMDVILLDLWESYYELSVQSIVFDEAMIGKIYCLWNSIVCNLWYLIIERNVLNPEQKADICLTTLSNGFAWFCFMIQFSYKFVCGGSFGYTSALVKVWALLWTGNKPLPEPMTEFSVLPEKADINKSNINNSVQSLKACYFFMLFNLVYVVTYFQACHNMY